MSNHTIFCNQSGIGYGVESDGGLLYEADMTKATATRLAEICNDHPDFSWDEARAILKAEGFDLRLVADRADVAAGAKAAGMQEGGIS